MEGTALWAEDRIGLRQLAEGGRLELKSASGHHLEFSLSWFTEHVLWPHLAVPVSAARGAGPGGAARPQASQALRR